MGRLVDALVRVALPRRALHERGLDHAARRRRSRRRSPPSSARWRRSCWCASGRFRGRMAFSGMVYAPLVMPEVIIGLSLLLLFVALERRPRLLDDHPRPHHADHVLRGRRRAVAPRHLRPLDRGGRARSRLPPLQELLPDHAADHRAGGRSPAGCWPSPCRSTISSSPASPPAPGATTLPMRIYSAVRLGVTPEINAACTLHDGRGHRRRGHRVDLHQAGGSGAREGRKAGGSGVILGARSLGSQASPPAPWHRHDRWKERGRQGLPAVPGKALPSLR